MACLQLFAVHQYIKKSTQDTDFYRPNASAVSGRSGWDASVAAVSSPLRSAPSSISVSSLTCEHCAAVAHGRFSLGTFSSQCFP